MRRTKLPKLQKLFKRAVKRRAERRRISQQLQAAKRWDKNRKLAEARSRMHAERNAARKALKERLRLEARKEACNG